MLKNHEGTFSIFQKIVDAIAIFACWVISYYLRFEFLPQAQPGIFDVFLKFSLILIPLTLWFYNRNGLYRSMRFSHRSKEILSVFRANTFAVLSFVIVLYFFAGERLSRTTIIIYFFTSSFILILTRLSIRNFLRALRARGKNLRHILLIGNGPQLKEYIHAARLYKDSGIRFLGWIDSAGRAAHLGIKEIDLSYQNYLLTNKPDTVVIGYKGTENEKVEKFLRENYNDVTPIQILPDLSFSLIGHQVEDFAGIPLLRINQPVFPTDELFVKRLFDLIGSTLGLVLLSPLLFIISIGVKLSSPGPCFYGQRRVGLDGKEFTMWKFRSMRLANNNEDEKVWGSKNNPRKTKFGEFIRKTSIDELPQLWNVLIGDMSLIGPRPERPHFVGEFRKQIPGYMLRHKMKAGITGWAQVNGWRGDTSIEKRIECDIYYIKHWSIWLDIKIVFLTFWKGFINKNAY